jgi:hypothetical protein
MKLHELRIKSDAFIQSINQKIDESIIFAEANILDLNREQMKQRQVDSNDENLPEYSSKWKSIKGLTYFNLFDTGDFQKKMKLSVKYPVYAISSTDWKLGKLLSRVGERMFGIAPSNQDKAKQATFTAFVRKYKSEVLK